MSFELFPPSASSVAGHVDGLLIFLLIVAGFFSVLICTAIVWFAVRYRRRRPDEIGVPVQGNLMLETSWIVIPLLITFVIFGWGADVYVMERRPPSDAMTIYGIAKQWMWRFQHGNGQKEINELHVPLNRDVKIVLASEDVIHDFFVPAFRTKFDVVPGRYTTVWFRATQTGKYHLFCSQYCGTNHALMRGEIIVMDPAEYQAWLSGGPGEGSFASSGEKLFRALGCNNCHRNDSLARAPDLQGLYGSTVRLTTGETVTADDAYVRESIVNPGAKIVAGFQNIMPTFQGLVSEEQILELTAYIKSLATRPQQPAAPGAPPINPQPIPQSPSQGTSP